MNEENPPMTCERLSELLVEHVDGLLGAAEAEGARTHLDSCGPCRLLQGEVRRNFAAMDAWEDEEVPEGAWDRLEARLHGRSAALRPETDASSPSPRRPWLRLAVPYAAGLATAAAAALLFIFAPGDVPSLHRGPEPMPERADPAAAPAVSPLADTGTGAMPVAAEGVVPAVPDALAENGAAPPLRPGEKRLRFEDVDRGIVRTLELPHGLDPTKVLLVEPPTAVPASGSEVR